MEQSFDPYAVFLGFPPGHPPRNYYELLGLPLFESDPEKIARAGEVLLWQVRQIQPGAYLGQWQQLLDELTAAKLCLLDTVTKSAYDAYLIQLGQNPPNSGAVAPADPSVAWAIPSAYPVVPQAGFGGSPFPPYQGQSGNDTGYSTPPGWGGFPGSGGQGGELVAGGGYPPAQGNGFPPMAGVPNGYPSSPEVTGPPLPGEKTYLGAKAAVRSRPSLWLFVAVCGGLVFLVVGLIYLFQRVRSEGPEVVLGNSSTANRLPSSEKSTVSPKEQKSSQGLPGQQRPKEKEKTTPHSPLRPEKPKPSASEGPGGQPSDTSEPKQPTETSSPPGESNGKKEPGISEKLSPKPEEKEKPSPKPEEKTASSPPKPSLDPVKQAAWEKAVGEIRSALARQEVSSAEEYIKTAEANAQTPEQQDVVERLRMLRHYLEEFWKGIRQSVSSLEAAQEFKVGATRFAIVEGNSQYLVVRAEGRNIRWPIEKIPRSVVEILAKRWFRSEDPATWLALGAYYAVRGDTEQARQYWERAGKSGKVDVSGLLEELKSWPLPEPSNSSSESPLR